LRWVAAGPAGEQDLARIRARGDAFVAGLSLAHWAPASEVAGEEIGPMAGTLMDIVRSLLGRAASDAQVRRCSMSVVSQVLFYHHCRPVVTRLFPDLKFKPKQIDELAQHITRFSLGALKERARQKR